MSAEIPTPRTDKYTHDHSDMMGNKWECVTAEFARGLEREIYRLSKSLDREIAINLERSHELGLMESAASLAREALSFYAEEGNWRCEGSLDGNSSNFDGWTPAKQALSALDAVLKKQQ